MSARPAPPAAGRRSWKPSRAGTPTAVRALLKQPDSVNVAEADGTTALHWATDRDDLATAGLLVRAGANVKAANRYGVTPLYSAAVNGNAAMIELLLKAGADANTALPEGETRADDRGAHRQGRRRAGAAGARRATSTPRNAGSSRRR